ncbi:hypothetical protein protein [Bacillus cereus G9241]|nr:hypothetical protein protein [Bacillus cereus G9241]EAL16148.1 hypothetical protein protein [Bacillus cereus G9241]
MKGGAYMYFYYDKAGAFSSSSFASAYCKPCASATASNVTYPSNVLIPFSNAVLPKQASL